jgi:hypothetical protein
MTLSTNITDTTNEANSKRRVISLSKKTYNRLAKFGRWSESADDIINRILGEREGKEVSEHSAS